MNTRHSFGRFLALAALGIASTLAALPARAQVADLADVPLANSPSTSVLPNLMFVLDDSGSMNWNYMPDFVLNSSGGDSYYNCKSCSSTSCSGPGGTSSTGRQCANSSPSYGEPPYYAPLFNKIWYNPNITYSPAVDSTGTPIFATNPATAARRDAFLDAGTVDDLTTGFREAIYCNTSSPSATDRTDPTKCRYNGKHNIGPFLAAQPDYFLYWKSNATQNGGLPNTTYRNRIEISNSNPHYYNITAHEYCSDVNLTTCALANADGSAPASFAIAAPLRWCKSAADATNTAVVTGNSGTPATPRCRKKFDRTAYPYPRYGRFKRVDITPAVASYPKSAASARTDCAAAASCTYDEEVQNFANWWSYYSKRMMLMKTAAGRAFLSIDDRYRIGFITINPNNPVTNDKFLGVGAFDTTQRVDFYDKLYIQDTNGSTPLRQALSRVGRYYGGINGGINAGMNPDPLQYSCQANYALLTTDGYWNSSSGVNLGGGGIGNQDNTNSGYTTRAAGAFDGNLTGASDTLADVAAYYYKTDLRTAGVLAPNNVPTSASDTAAHQHMVVFSLGLGLEGFMDYRSDYDTATSGDFYKIKNSDTGCSWATGTCNWPVPSQNMPSTLDDLWHAAVNSRGAYFSASDPNSLALGLQSALAKLQVQTAAAAASATSSPNITETDNYIYSSTFRTGNWDGEVVAQRIDVTTGNVLPAIAWSAQGLLDARTSANSDSRLIFTIDDAGANKRKNFSFVTLSSTPSGSIDAEQSYFANKCGNFSQCTLLTVAQQAVANNGDNLVNYLRGQRQHETFAPPESIPPFRAREHVLGDPVNATPAFVRNPVFSFADAVTPTYADYKAAQAGRQSVLYIAANDGMLHALNGDTGQEMWAYVPRIVMPNMHKIATANWGATHRFSVDGSPQVMDVFLGGSWKTILVAGLNSGGRGFYALDVTDPSTPKVLWEVCSDNSLCLINDNDIGYSYGNPVIAKRASDGKWVVFITSGINNVSPGNGKGYLYVLDAQTGAILDKVNTNFGNAAAPSGLNDISGYADNFAVNNTAKFIYGGDLWGNVWKFDTQTSPPTVSKLAELKDSGGKPQSITTRPELALIEAPPNSGTKYPVVYVGTGRYIGEDDLGDPAAVLPANGGPLPFAYQQSLYAIKDKGVTYGNFRAGNVVENTIIDGGTTRTTSNNTVDWSLQDGWFVDFNPGDTSPGERVNLDPQLIQGTLLVVTNVPNNSACSVGGDSWIYQFDYKSGTNVASSAGGIAGQKFTGQITVGVVVVRLPSGVFKGIATGATGSKTPFAVNIGGAGGSARRISWRELIQR